MTLRIGIIGVGGRGDLARQWDSANSSGRSCLVAGADTRDDLLKKFVDDATGSPFVTKDWRELVARDDVEAVGIFTPDFLHEEMAVAALEAGKHVFCEKPLAITTEGCDRILDAWNRAGTKLMVGFNMRYMNVFRVMKDIVDRGDIGEVKAIWVRHFVGHGGTFYYHDWHATRANTTSLLLQKGSHDIDMIHYLTGQYSRKVAAFGGLDWYGGEYPNDKRCRDCEIQDTCPDRQWPDCPRDDLCAFRKEVDVEDNQTMIMQLDGGIKASYLQCHFAPVYERNYVLIGTEGSLENIDSDKEVRVKMRPIKKDKNLADRVYTIRPSEGTHSGADPVIAKDFLDMVQKDKAPVATPIAGRMAVAAGCAGAESMRDGGRPVDIAPVKG
jgi:predicted dehydrogenase